MLSVFALYLRSPAGRAVIARDNWNAPIPPAHPARGGFSWASVKAVALKAAEGLFAAK
jgi:hypothetical protein